MPVVFVVDDDVSVRESLEALIATAGWRTKAFASALDFLGSCHDRCPESPARKRRPLSASRRLRSTPRATHAPRRHRRRRKPRASLSTRHPVWIAFVMARSKAVSLNGLIRQL